MSHKIAALFILCALCIQLSSCRRPTNEEYKDIENRLGQFRVYIWGIPPSAFSLKNCLQYECDFFKDAERDDIISCTDTSKDILRNSIYMKLISNGRLRIRNTYLDYDEMLSLIDCLSMESMDGADDAWIFRGDRDSRKDVIEEEKVEQPGTEQQQKVQEEEEEEEEEEEGEEDFESVDSYIAELEKAIE